MQFCYIIRFFNHILPFYYLTQSVIADYNQGLTGGRPIDLTARQGRKEEMERCYPICLDVDSRRCIVVGGGQVAQRKVLSLVACAASVRIISPSLTIALEKLASEGKVEHIDRVYQPGDLKGAFLVVAATDDKSLNRSVVEEAKKRGVLHNVADTPGECSFFVPAVLRRGHLTIAVSTDGKVPALASLLRKKLEEIFDERKYTEITAFLSEARTQLMAKTESPEKRKESLYTLANMLLEGESVAEAREFLKQVLESEAVD